MDLSRSGEIEALVFSRVLRSLPPKDLTAFLRIRQGFSDCRNEPTDFISIKDIQEKNSASSEDWNLESKFPPRLLFSSSFLINAT